MIGRELKAELLGVELGRFTHIVNRKHVVVLEDSQLWLRAA